MIAYHNLDIKLYAVTCVLDAMQFILGDQAAADADTHRQQEALRTLLAYAHDEVHDATHCGDQLRRELLALQQQIDRKEEVA